MLRARRNSVASSSTVGKAENSERLADQQSRHQDED